MDIRDILNPAEPSIGASTEHSLGTHDTSETAITEGERVTTLPSWVASFPETKINLEDPESEWTLEQEARWSARVGSHINKIYTPSSDVSNDRWFQSLPACAVSSCQYSSTNIKDYLKRHVVDNYPIPRESLEAFHASEALEYLTMTARLQGKATCKEHSGVTSLSQIAPDIDYLQNATYEPCTVVYLTRNNPLLESSRVGEPVSGRKRDVRRCQLRVPTSMKDGTPWPLGTHVQSADAAWSYRPHCCAGHVTTEVEALVRSQRNTRYQETRRRNQTTISRSQARETEGGVSSEPTTNARLGRLRPFAEFGVGPNADLTPSTKRKAASENDSSNVAPDLHNESPSKLTRMEGRS